MEIEEKLSKLKTELDRVNQEKIRAELARESALSSRDSALAELKAFDVDSIEDARTKLETLEKELAEAISKAESALDEIN